MPAKTVRGGSRQRLVRLRRYCVESGTQDGGVWHVAENPVGYDTTLCGLADEGEGNGRGDEKVFDEKDGTRRGVTCEQCNAIIDFCAALGTKPNAGDQRAAESNRESQD